MNTKIEECIELKEAKRIFSDADHYDEQQLIGYYKLLRGVEKDTIFLDKSELVSTLEKNFQKLCKMHHKIIDLIFFQGYTLLEVRKLLFKSIYHEYSINLEYDLQSAIAKIRWCRIGFDARVCNVLLRNNIFEISQFQNLKKEEIKKFRGVGQKSILQILEMHEKLFPNQIKGIEIVELQQTSENLLTAKKVFIDADNYSDEEVLICYTLMKKIEENLTEKSERIAEIEKILKKYGYSLKSVSKKMLDTKYHSYIIAGIRWYKMGFESRVCNILLRNNIFEISQFQKLKKHEIKKFRGAGEKSISQILEAQKSLFES